MTIDATAVGLTPDTPVYDTNQDWRTVLKLPKVANWDTVGKAYKKRRIESHPDKGGSNEEFTAVEAAFQAAKKHFGFK